MPKVLVMASGKGRIWNNTNVANSVRNIATQSNKTGAVCLVHQLSSCLAEVSWKANSLKNFISCRTFHILQIFKLTDWWSEVFLWHYLSAESLPSYSSGLLSDYAVTWAVYWWSIKNVDRIKKTIGSILKLFEVHLENTYSLDLQQQAIQFQFHRHLWMHLRYGNFKPLVVAEACNNVYIRGVDFHAGKFPR